MTILKYYLAKIYTEPNINSTPNETFLNIFADNIDYYMSTKSIHMNMIWDLCINNPIYYVSRANKYIYFDKVFDSYTYKSVYDSDLNIFTTKITKKHYNIILSIRLTKLIKLEKSTPDILNILNKLFILIQICQIKSKKNHNTNNIEQFISVRETEYLYFDIWHHFRMDLTYVFDMKETIIKKIPPEIFFSRLGGIIETNNVAKLIRTYFRKNRSDDFIIGPRALCQLWPGYNRITFEDILTTPIIKLKKINFNRLIIHECDEKMLPIIKNIANQINPKIIWIINALPLTYYFNKSKSKLNANNLLTLTNLWLRFDNNQKKIYKRELLRLIFTDFNKLYTRYFYELDLSNLPQINLFDKSNWIEKYIYQKINSYYYNWRNKLSNDADNIYSTATLDKFSKIEAGILNTYFNLINQIGLKSDIHDAYFNENNLCPICYDTDNPIQTVLVCGHQFCFDCVLRSLSKSLECPICRKQCSITNIRIFPELDIVDGMISNLKMILSRESVGLITDIPWLNSYFEKNIIDCNNITDLLIIEKNISRCTKQIINYFNLYGNKIKFRLII